MLTFYLTRHGETQWNKENRLQGSKDSLLTEKGIKDAILLGKHIMNIDFHAIYSSPRKRALQTAKYLKLDKDIPIYTIEGLQEIHFGDWEGKTKEEITALDVYKNEFHNFWTAPQSYNHKLHKAESLITFKDRVENAVRRIISDNKDGNILIVTHAVVIRAIMSFTMNIPTARMWDPPFIHGASLTIFNWDGERFNFQVIGDISHLDNTIK